MTTVTLTALTKAYAPETPAVSGVDLQVRDGELLALLGPSGSGKTTILRLIAGLLQPTSGDILFDGDSILTLPPEERGAVMVFQEHALFPFMTVGDNMAFGLKMQRLDKATIAQRVTNALASVQLTGYEDRWPPQLSGGQQQRIALARALVIRPKLLLLDEPLSNLDQSLRGDMRNLIRTLQRDAGITTLLVTHDQSEALAIADRIALLVNGTLLQVGKPDAFYNGPATLDVARFFGATNFIPAVKRGTLAETAFGAIELAASEVPDGDVVLVIRPESAEISADPTPIRATIQSIDYAGTAVQICATAGGIPIFIRVPPHHTHTVGDTVFITLPPERITPFAAP